tara:strand:+ start:233 stop:496 length:264 start_codon:yes stop_codon:yes gene_type:complete
MSDVICPYCKTEQEINHDDGYGYEESVEHEQNCVNCSKYFKFTTSISFSYEVMCQDGDHDMEPFGDEWPDMYQCKNCDFYERRRLIK